MTKNTDSKTNFDSHQSDEKHRQLVLLSQAGDQDALVELWTSSQPIIQSVFCNVCRLPLPAEDFDDCKQEVWLILHTSISELRDADKFFCWLSKIVRHIAFGYLRGKKRYYRCLLRIRDKERFMLPKHYENEAVLEAIRREEVEKRNELLARLNERDAEIYRRHVDNEEALSEIAKDMEIPHGTVKNAFQRLRKIVGKTCGNVPLFIVGLTSLFS